MRSRCRMWLIGVWAAVGVVAMVSFSPGGSRVPGWAAGATIALVAVIAPVLRCRISDRRRQVAELRERSHALARLNDRMCGIRAD